MMKVKKKITYIPSRRVSNIENIPENIKGAIRAIFINFGAKNTGENEDIISAIADSIMKQFSNEDDAFDFVINVQDDIFKKFHYNFSPKKPLSFKKIEVHNTGDYLADFKEAMETFIGRIK